MYIRTVAWLPANEDAHHYLIFVGRRHAAVVIVVPLSIVFVLGVRGI